MGANDKVESTCHGGEKPPTTEDVRWWLISPEYAGGPTNEQLGKKYDRMIAQVRAEAKAEALEQYHADILYIDRVIECKAEPDDRWYDFIESENEWRTEEKQGGRSMFCENAGTYYAKYRANQYKEEQ